MAQRLSVNDSIQQWVDKINKVFDQQTVDGAFTNNETFWENTTFSLTGGKVRSGTSVLDVPSKNVTLPVGKVSVVGIDVAGVQLTSHLDGSVPDANFIPLYVVQTNNQRIVKVTDIRTWAYEDTGAAEAAVQEHEAKSDPHTQYATDTKVDQLDQQTNYRIDALVFDSVQAMKDAEWLEVGNKVRTLGYYEAGDGGGNDYEIVASATGTADGGSFIDLDNGLQASGLFENGRVYATQFGVHPDQSASFNSDAMDRCITFTNITYVPNIGVYNLSRPINITSDDKGIFGERRGGGTRLNFESETGIHYTPQDTQDGSRVRTGQIRDLFITGPMSSGPASGYALNCTMCGTFRAENIAFQGFTRGILIQGGQSLYFHNIRGFNGVFSDITDVSGRYLFHVRPHERENLSTIPVYVVSLLDFEFGGGLPWYNVEDVFRIEGVDGFNIDNGYINGGRESLFHLTSLESSAAGAIVGLQCSNVYHDGTLNSGGSNYGLKVSRDADAGQSGGVVNGVLFQNSTFANYKNSAIYSPQGRILDLSVNHCNIKNSNGRIIDIEAATNSDIQLSNNRIKDGHGIRIDNANTLTLTNNLIKEQETNEALVLSGVMGKLILGGNTYTGNAVGDFRNSLTSLGSAAIGEDAGDTNNYPDRGNFVPEFLVGGSYADWIFSTIFGNYVISKNVVYFRVAVVLSSKGADTGIVEIRIPSMGDNGLTIPMSTENVAPVSVRANNVGGAGDSFGARIIGTGGAAALGIRIENREGDGGLDSITDTDVNNNSNFFIQGFYFID